MKAGCGKVQHIPLQGKRFVSNVIVLVICTILCDTTVWNR